MKRSNFLILIGLTILLCGIYVIGQGMERMTRLTFHVPRNSGPHNSDEPNHWASFPQMDSCYLQGGVEFLFTQADLDSGQNRNFKLVQHLQDETHTYPLTVGQKSIYEADEHDKYGDSTGGYFLHEHVVGREKRDEPQAANDWAWYAEPDSDEAGYVMRDLKDDYNREQGDPLGGWAWGGTYSITFYADFLIKISDTTYQESPFLNLFVLRLGWDTAACEFTILDTLADSSLFASDFYTPGVYQNIPLTFQRVKEDTGALDYRIWWDGSRAIWLDRITVQDQYARSVLAGEHNDEIREIVQGRDSYLFRWYLQDEPQGDKFDVQAYLVSFLRDSVSAKPGIQTKYDLSNMGEFLNVVQPEELWYDSYMILPTTSTSTDSGNLQEYLSTLTDRIGFSKSNALSQGIPLIYVPQCFESYDIWKQGTPKTLRYPTQYEQRCLVWRDVASRRYKLCICCVI